MPAGTHCFFRLLHPQRGVSSKVFQRVLLVKTQTGRTGGEKDIKSTGPKLRDSARAKSAENGRQLGRNCLTLLFVRLSFELFPDFVHADFVLHPF